MSTIVIFKRSLAQPTKVPGTHEIVSVKNPRLRDFQSPLWNRGWFTRWGFMTGSAVMGPLRGCLRVIDSQMVLSRRHGWRNMVSWVYLIVASISFDKYGAGLSYNEWVSFDSVFILFFVISAAGIDQVRAIYYGVCIFGEICHNRRQHNWWPDSLPRS